MHTSKGTVLTELILDLFKLNGQLLSAGDRLVGDLGLTSARWQVLGIIAAAKQPQPVAWIARDMEAHRQNVQRIVNDMEKSGLVAFKPNPHHRRAHLVVLTPKGQETFEAAMQVQVPWVNNLADEHSIDDINTACRVLQSLRQKLEGDTGENDA